MKCVPGKPQRGGAKMEARPRGIGLMAEDRPDSSCSVAEDAGWLCDGSVSLLNQ